MALASTASVAVTAVADGARSPSMASAALLSPGVGGPPEAVAKLGMQLMQVGWVVQ